MGAEIGETDSEYRGEIPIERGEDMRLCCSHTIYIWGKRDILCVHLSAHCWRYIAQGEQVD